MKPGSTPNTRTKLFIIRAAPASNTSAESDFGCHQGAADAVTGSRRRVSRPFLEALIQIGLRRLKRRRQPEENSRQQGDPDRETQNHSVDTDLLRRRVPVRGERDEHCNAGEGEQHTQQATQEGKQHAFGEQLADHAPPAGPERGTQGNLRLPCGAASQEQVGHVAAGDEQNETDSAQKQIQWVRVSGGKKLAYGCEVHDPTGEHAIGGLRRRVPASNSVELSLGLLDGNAGF